MRLHGRPPSSAAKTLQSLYVAANMSSTLFRFRLAALILLAGFTAQSARSAEPPPVDKESAGQIRRAQEMVNRYHRDAEPARNVIRIVYFHPNDQPPLPKWRERLSRIADDVERFYHDGMTRLGSARTRVLFEKNTEGYVFHVVQGKHELGHYSYEFASGAEIEREIRQALGRTIDFDREHVLAIHGLCRREKSGRYVFNAPYYGGGSQRNGFCHAADCELLDPKLLTENKQKILYAEHYYPRVSQTIGLFNSRYLGGIAHELGHGIGLPHDSGPPTKRSSTTGFTLMGSGNHHYREDLWGGKQPAYLGLGSGLRLLSNPLVTGSNRGRFEKPETQLTKLNFAQNDETLALDGVIASPVPAYAAILYLWRPQTWPGNPQQDHGSTSFPTTVSDNEFHLEAKAFQAGDYRLRVSVLHCNGAAADFDFHLSVDRNGRANVSELNSTWLLSRAEAAVSSGESDVQSLLTEHPIQSAASPEVQSKLRALRDLLQPPPPVNLATTQAASVSLSDADWKSAQVGWGEVARNHYNRDKEHRNSIYLELKGKFCEKGLYAHSTSAYTFDLARRWKRFSATVGLRDGATKQGSAVFTVLGDGKPLHKSKILRAGESETIEIDVSGVGELQLKADGGEGHVHNSWAIWAAPIVKR